MKFVLFLGVVAVVLVSGEAFKCYQCLNCNDPFTKNDSLLIECKGTTPSCTKGIITFKNGSTIVGRDCSPDISDMHSSIKKIPSPNLTLFETANIYFCDSEGCNGTGSITAVLSIIFTTLIASIFASF